MADTPDSTPAGQAAVNSNTVLGATLGTLAGLGEDPVFTPAVTTLLVVATKLTQEQAARPGTASRCARRGHRQ